jgi:hypothetical protein
MDQPVIIDRAVLMDAVIGQVGRCPELADQSYVLVSADWLNGEFSDAYRDFLTLFGLGEWQAESNDCDKFAGWAGAVGTALHSRTRQKFGHLPSALAFGVWFYKPDWSPSHHAIRWFAYGVPVDEAHPAGIAVGFYEPAGNRRHVVELSIPEINSCTKCAA